MRLCDTMISTSVDIALRGDYMIPVPDYLKRYASNPIQKGNRLSFEVMCSCGCKLFHIFKINYSDDEKRLIEEYQKRLPRIGLHSVYGGWDAKGHHYQYIKILGIFKKKLEFPIPPIFESINISKVVCSKCQNEIILFDSRYHGYDAMNFDDKAAKKYELDFRVRDREIYGVEVVVENELSLREFQDAMGGACSLECYSNSFRHIRIKITDEKGKKFVICDSETA